MCHTVLFSSLPPAMISATPENVPWKSISTPHSVSSRMTATWSLVQWTFLIVVLRIRTSPYVTFLSLILNWYAGTGLIVTSAVLFQKSNIVILYSYEFLSTSTGAVPKNIEVACTYGFYVWSSWATEIIAKKPQICNQSILGRRAEPKRKS